MRIRSTSRTVSLAISAVLIGTFVAIFALEAVLRLFHTQSGLNVSALTADQPVLHFHPNVDYRYSRGWHFLGANSGHINNYGFVNNQDYQPTATTPLGAIIGDSYVEALMIPYEQTFHGILAKDVSPQGRIYSFGMSGAPLSQYLSWASWISDTFHPNLAVIVIVGNDFDESLIRYKSSLGYYFDDSQADMPLVRVDYQPRSSWLRWSVLYRYLRDRLSAIGAIQNILSLPNTVQYVGNVPEVVETERIERSKHVVDTFLERLPLATHLPTSDIILVVDGMRPNLYNANELEKAQTSYFGVMRRYLISHAGMQGFEIVDMEPAFMTRHQRSGEVFEFPDDGHWNQTAQEIVADAVRRTPAFERTFGLR